MHAVVPQPSLTSRPLQCEQCCNIKTSGFHKSFLKAQKHVLHHRLVSVILEVTFPCTDGFTQAETPLSCWIFPAVPSPPAQLPRVCGQGLVWCPSHSPCAQSPALLVPAGVKEPLVPLSPPHQAPQPGGTCPAVGVCLRDCLWGSLAYSSVVQLTCINSYPSSIKTLLGVQTL